MKYCTLVLIIAIAYTTIVISNLIGDELSSFKITPAGLRHKSCIHKVPPQSRVIPLEDGSGRFAIHQNNIDTIIENCEHTVPNEDYYNSIDANVNGWVAYAFSEVVANFTLFLSNMVVPPEPKSKNENSLLFYFIGLLDKPYNKHLNQFQILQPVLQWGESACGGGEYWAIGAWGVLDGSVFCSQLYQVNAGDEIFMSINQTCIAPDQWSVTALSSTGMSVELNVFPSDELCWACVTLEAFFVTNCMDYPDNTTGTVLFNGLSLSSVNVINDPLWNATIDTRDLYCNQSVDIVDTTEIIIGF